MTTMRIATTNPFEGLEEIVKENVPLAPRTWYKIGGPARWFIQPRNPEELREAVYAVLKMTSRFTSWASVPICWSATPG